MGLLDLLVNALDAIEEEKEQMRKREEEILGKLKITRD